MFLEVIFDCGHHTKARSEEPHLLTKLSQRRLGPSDLFSNTSSSYSHVAPETVAPDAVVGAHI